MVILTAVPDEGYQLDRWDILSGNVTITNNQFTIGTKDVEIQAEFKLKPPPAPDSVSAQTDPATGTATVTGPASATATSVKIPNTVTGADGVSYPVTHIADGAFKGMKKLKKVSIGKNITAIGANAFSGCKKLKTVSIKSTRLKKVGFGKNCFKGIDAGATFKVPKKSLKNYTKWIRKPGGAPKTMTVK